MELIGGHTFPNGPDTKSCTPAKCRLAHYLLWNKVPDWLEMGPVELSCPMLESTPRTVSVSEALPDPLTGSTACAMVADKMVLARAENAHSEKHLASVSPVPTLLPPK